MLTDAAVRRDVAMTGEITLRGKVLPVGGIKEKLLAAHRAGITTVLIPKDNAKDLVELPEDVRQALTIEIVESVDQVWRLALEEPLPKVDVPPTEVPIWGQQPTSESTSSNQAIE